MTTQIYDKSYTADAGLAASTGPAPSASNQYLAVVQGAEDGGVALPGAQNAPKVMGITQTAQSGTGGSISVRKLGVSYAWSKGAISAGDHVAIYSASGDVYSVEAAIEAGLHNPAEVIYTVGVAETSVTGDGMLVEIFVNPVPITLAVS